MEKQFRRIQNIAKAVGLAFILVVSGCHPESPGEIYWYSGAAMKKPAQEIVERYNKQGGNVVLVTGGSGQVLHQIMSSQRGDLYSPMNEHFKNIALQKNIATSSYPLVQVEPVFALAPKTRGVESFADLLHKEVKLATGNPEAMALGKAWRKISGRMPQKMRTILQQKIAIEPVNISQTVNYIKTGTVDAGLVFDAVARNNGLKFVRLPDKYNLIQRAYLMPVKYSVFSKKRKRFVRFVLEHKDIYKKYGFTPVSE